MYWKEQVKPILSSLAVFAVLVILVSQFIIGNPAFDKKQNEIVLNAGDSWIEERQKRRDSIAAARKAIKDSVNFARQKKRDSILNARKNKANLPKPPEEDDNGEGGI